MKRILTFVSLLGLLLVNTVHAQWQGSNSTETTVSVNGNYPSSQSGLEINVVFPLGSTTAGELYYVHIGGGGIDIDLEFTTGYGGSWVYVSDRSTATSYYLYYYNWGDSAAISLDSIGSGSYTISLSGPGVESTHLSAYAY